MWVSNFQFNFIYLFRCSVYSTPIFASGKVHQLDEWGVPRHRQLGPKSRTSKTYQVKFYFTNPLHKLIAEFILISAGQKRSRNLEPLASVINSNDVCHCMVNYELRRDKSVNTKGNNPSKPKEFIYCLIVFRYAIEKASVTDQCQKITSLLLPSLPSRAVFLNLFDLVKPFRQTPKSAEPLQAPKIKKRNYL